MLSTQCSLGIQQKLHMLGTFQNLIFLKAATLCVVFKRMRRNSWNQMWHNSPPLPVKYIPRNQYQTRNFLLTPSDSKPIQIRTSSNISGFEVIQRIRNGSIGLAGINLK